MRTRRTLAGTLVLGLLLVLGMGPGLAQGPAEGAHAPQGYAIQAAVSSKFSYQGVLKENGVPVTGTRDMAFRLYSNATCTTIVGTTISKPNVQVTDGVFSVELEVNQANLNGQGLWLAVAVEGTPVACQAILPVPYALGLRPGAEILGNGTVLSVSSTNDDALTVETASTTTHDAAIRGVASAASGLTYAVVGENNSTYQTAAGGRFSGNAGIWITSTGSGFGAVGVYAEGGDTGLYIGGPDSYGVRVTSAAGHSSGYGIHVDNSYGVGVFADSVKTSNEWGLYTPAKLYVGTTMVTGGPLLLVAQNGGAAALEPGDVVVAAGLGRAFADGPSPVMLVRRADGASGQAVAGVVYSLFVAEEEVDEHYAKDGVETTTHWITHSAEGPVAPGEYLLLCVLGPCPVKADAGGGTIQAGDTLSVSGTQGRAARAKSLTLEGVSFYPPGVTFGTALEPLEAGTGLIQVFVRLR